MSIQPGTDIGRYHILEQIGEGGMAVVFKAFDKLNNKTVALKIIRIEAFNELTLPRVAKRLQREAKVLASLNHPNIISLHDFGFFNQTPYLVLDYFAGSTLKEQKKPLPFDQAADILLPIADALVHAHQMEILHRDVKPSNILINAAGEIRLSDFGIAKILENRTDETTLTATGTGIGTPEYMSPEQGRGMTVDARTDIYSLGVVYYELVTGRKPFIADTPMAVVIKHITDPLPNPHLFINELPKVAGHVISKALAKNPDDRYTSVQEFQHDLKLLATKNIEEIIIFDNKEQFSRSVLTNQTDLTIDNPSNPHIENPKKVRANPQKYIGSVHSIQLGKRKNNIPFILLIIIGILGSLIMGIFFINKGLQADFFNANQGSESNPTPLPISAEITSNGFENSLPVEVTMSPDVIQFINAAKIQKIETWKDAYAQVGAWQNDSQVFYAAGMGYGYGRYTTDGLPPQYFREDMRYEYMAAFSSLGTYYATTDQGKQLFIWKHGETQPHAIIDGVGVSTITRPVFSPDGNLLVCLIDKNVLLLSTDTGSIERIVQANVENSNNDWSPRLIFKFSSDGSKLAIGNNETGEISVHDVSTGRLMHSYQWHTGVWDLEFSRDGKLLASSSILFDNRDIIKVWDEEHQSLLYAIQKSNLQINSIDFSFTGDLLISGSRTGVIQLWNVLDGSQLATLDVSDRQIEDISFSPDGKFFISVGEDINLWGIQP